MSAIKRLEKDRSESLAATAMVDDMEMEDGTMPEEAVKQQHSARGAGVGQGNGGHAEEVEEEGYDSESERLFSNHLLHVVSALGGRDVVQDKYIPGDEAIGEKMGLFDESHTKAVFSTIRLYSGLKEIFEDG